MEQNLITLGTQVVHEQYGVGEIVDYGVNHIDDEIARGKKYAYYHVRFEGETNPRVFQIEAIGTWLRVR